MGDLGMPARHIAFPSRTNHISSSPPQFKFSVARFLVASIKDETDQSSRTKTDDLHQCTSKFLPPRLRKGERGKGGKGERGKGENGKTELVATGLKAQTRRKAKKS